MKRSASKLQTLHIWSYGVRRFKAFDLLVELSGAIKSVYALLIVALIVEELDDD